MYLVGILAVAFLLAWSLLWAWSLFLGLTAFVLLFSFRGMFPSSKRDAIIAQTINDAPSTRMMLDLELSISKGFEGGDPQARKKTLETLERVFAQKVRRKLRLDDRAFLLLKESPDYLEKTIGGTELIQLLTGKLKVDRGSWDLRRLNRLITEVEDWGR